MNILQKLFQTKQATRQTINVFNNVVQEPVTFKELSFEQLEYLYSSLSDVRIVEDFISDNIAKIPVGVYNTRDTEKFNTPLNQLIEQTNPTQSWAEFVKEVFILYGLTGNIFVHRTPESGYLYTLLTSDVNISLGKDKTIPEFLNYIAGYWYQIGGKEYPLEVDNVLHMKGASLASENGLWSYGCSPYSAGTPNIETLNATYSSRVSTIRDRGAMGILSNESEFPDAEESKKVKERLKGNYGLLEDQDKLIITTQKLNYQATTLNVQELQMLENLEYDFDTICQLRGIDPVLFSSKGTTFNNQDSARSKAINNVIVPLADKFYNKLNEWISMYYDGLVVRPKYDELPEYGNINKDLSDKTINEVGAGIITKTMAFDMLYPNTDPIDEETTVGAGSGENVQTQSLNGAQVSSMIQVVESVSAGTMDRQSGISILIVSFGLTEAQASSIVTEFTAPKPIETGQGGEDGGF